MSLMGQFLGQRFEKLLTVLRRELPELNFRQRLTLYMDLLYILVSVDGRRFDVKFVSSGIIQTPIKASEIARSMKSPSVSVPATAFARFTDARIVLILSLNFARSC